MGGGTMTARIQINPSHQGHRRRLRQRMERVTEEALEDYELLELLLTFAIPRKDTKSLAKELLQHFTGLNGLLRAERSQIEEISGIGPRASLLISLIEPLFSRALLVNRAGRVILSSPEAAAGDFQSRLGSLPVEQVHAAYVNARNVVTVAECIQEGTVDQSVVYPRKVLERALFHKASGFILAHNHPSGETNPSPQDRRLTEMLLQAARPLGVRFLDHLVIGEGEPFSFRKNGLLPLE
jgi:DNA repair protein RadC